MRSYESYSNTDAVGDEARLDEHGNVVVVQDQKLARLQTLRFGGGCLRTKEVGDQPPSVVAAVFLCTKGRGNRWIPRCLGVLRRDQHFRGLPFFRNYL